MATVKATLFSFPSFFLNVSSSQRVSPWKRNYVSTQIPSSSSSSSLSVLRPSIQHNDLQSSCNTLSRLVMALKTLKNWSNGCGEKGLTVVTLRSMKLIDTLPHLGIAYHFQEEVNAVLDLISTRKTHEDDLFVAALSFRLLRENGYHVSPGMILRLWDDLGTWREEQQRGDVASSIECTMRDHNISSADEACNYLRQLNHNLWTELNGQLLAPSGLLLSIIKTSLNLSRTTQVIYQQGDDNKASSVEDHIQLLLFNLDPFPEELFLFW